MYKFLTGKCIPLEALPILLGGTDFLLAID